MTSVKENNFDTIKPLEWPKHLRTPKELIQALRGRTQIRIVKSPLYSKLILQFIGGWSYVLANIFSTTRIHNLNVFNEELKRIEAINSPKDDRISGDQVRESDKKFPRQGPLITLSNHISCIDDPILWGALLPFSYYSTNTDTVRWSAAAVDICFSKPWHSTFFSLGKTFPIIRGIGLEQPAMDYALALLNHNQWLHLFPEGRVMRDSNQQMITNIDRGYIFKWGTAKLILDHFKSSHARNEMKILPFYHMGMDKILPIGRPYFPRFGKKLTIYIRPSAINMNRKMLKDIIINRKLSSSIIKSKTDDEIKRIKLTNYLEEELEHLKEPSIKLHEENK